MRYAIAPNGIFWSVQGEGVHAGKPGVFVRLAGCSVGCAGCDTDWSVSEKLALPEVMDRVQAELRGAQWVWLTGGEPADIDPDAMGLLMRGLWRIGMKISVATSGHKAWAGPAPQFMSISPHCAPTDVVAWAPLEGEIKLVDELNGLSLNDWEGETPTKAGWVHPLSVEADGAWACDPESVARCVAFVRRNPSWKLGSQQHHAWGIA